jgi:hypothetical protein
MTITNRHGGGPLVALDPALNAYPAGRHLGAASLTAVDADLTADRIQAGITIFGVLGTFMLLNRWIDTFIYLSDSQSIVPAPNYTKIITSGSDVEIVAETGDAPGDMISLLTPAISIPDGQTLNPVIDYTQDEPVAPSTAIDRQVVVTGAIAKNNAVLTDETLPAQDNQPATRVATGDADSSNSGIGAGPLTFSIAASADDSSLEEYSTDYNNSLTYGTMGRKDTGVAMPVALRFTGISIPVGATITAAKITFKAKSSKVDAPVLTILGEETATPAAYGAAEDFTARATTTATVSWTPGAWTAESSYDTGDFKTIIQELVNSYAPYVAGDIAIQIRGTAGVLSWIVKTFYTYDGDSAKVPILSITYTLNYIHNDSVNRMGYASSAARNSGMKFTGISIPAGATIDSAYIYFTASVARTGQTVTVTIKGEASATPADYGATEDFTARAYNATTVNWTVDTAWVVNGQYRSADIKTIIAALLTAYGPYVVGDMAFEVINNGSSGTNYQDAYSCDASAAKAPILVITYTKASDMNLLPAVPVATEDGYYFGFDTEFDSLLLNIGTVGVGVWTITWKYWDGGAWANLGISVDGTVSFLVATTGWKEVSFTRPGDWATVAVSGITKYWIFADLTAYTSIVTAPKGTQAKILELGI